MAGRPIVLSILVVAACGGPKGPKITLRYHPPAGAVYHYSFEQRTLLTMQSGPLSGMGKQQLHMRMHFTQSIKGPAVGGGTEVAVVYDSTSLEMPGMGADAMAGELATLRGLRGTVVFDDRAQIVRSDFAQPPGATPEMLNQLRAGINAMTFVFPEQPVGRGDSWTVSAELSLAQLPGTNASKAGPARTTLTVREIRAHGADTSVMLDIKTEFPSGPIQLTVAGQAATLRMSGALSGNQHYSLTRGTLVDATIKGAAKMSVTAAPLGLKQEMVMVSEMENTLHLLDGK